MRSILFVCTANICRSPMAEGVLRKLLKDAGLREDIRVDSVGTHDYHVGKPPYVDAVASAKKRGYEIDHLVSRRIGPDDFDQFDFILGMDKSNLASLRAVSPTRCKQKIELLLEYGDKFHGMEIPDPYGGEAKQYERALDMIEDGCRGLLELLKRSSAKR